MSDLATAPLPIVPRVVAVDVFVKAPEDGYCPQCGAVERLLNKLVGLGNYGVFTRLEGDGPEVYEEARQAGLQSAPVTRFTYADGSTLLVSGNNGPKIKALLGV